MSRGKWEGSKLHHKPREIFRVNSWSQGWTELKAQRKKTPELFCHWHMIRLSKRELYDGRLSRTVL